MSPATSETRAGQAPAIPPLVDGHAARRPRATAIVDGDRVLDFAGLRDESRRAAAGLARLGVGPGDRVALWLPNVAAWLVLHVACARLGAVTVAVNTRFRSVEVGDILRRAGAKVLVVWPDFKGIDFAGILAEIPSDALDRLERVILYAPDGAGKLPAAPVPALPYASLLEAGTAAAGAGDGHAGSIVFTTSGTTSSPKLVLHTQRSIALHARDVAPGFGYTDADCIVLQALPLCGTFGHAQAMAALAAGRPVVLQSVFDPQEAAGLVRRHRVTHCNGADVMFAGLLDAAAPGDLDSLRHGGFAAFGAVSPHDLAARADGAGLRLVGLYGMSEVQALYARRHAHAGIAERVRAGGYPVSDAARVRVRDPDADAPLPPGDAGELQLRGPSLFGEYLGNPEATAAAFTDDGWFKTGDLATADDGGGFEFLARMGDSLRLGGFLVHPGEIEAQVEHDDSVTSCQVVGVPGERGLRPVAFVIPAPGARIDEAAIVARCRSSLAGYKVPSHVFAIEAFPVTRSANGEKVQRNRLREMALEHLGGA